ncbi:MAG: hypothetical protein CM15mV29_0620 [uncultured marine virus]|jgi:hypothetical protein|nr:MAG: hypothetical protein CM15mV29_0620 [uncultured marine virus]
MNYDEALMKKRVADMDCDEVKCAHCGSQIGTQTPVVYDVIYVQPKGHKGAKDEKRKDYGERVFFCNSECAEAAESGETCHISNNTRIYNEKRDRREDIVFTDFMTYGNKPIHSSEYSFRAIGGLTIENMAYGGQRFNAMVKWAGQKCYINTMPNDPMEPLARNNWAPSVQQDVLSLRAYMAAVMGALA